MNVRFKKQLNYLLGVLSAMAILCIPLRANENDSVLVKLKTIDTISTTVPSNGDVNPYGLVRLRDSFAASTSCEAAPSAYR